MTCRFVFPITVQVSSTLDVIWPLSGGAIEVAVVWTLFTL